MRSRNHEVPGLRLKKLLICTVICLIATGIVSSMSAEGNMKGYPGASSYSGPGNELKISHGLSQKITNSGSGDEIPVIVLMKKQKIPASGKAIQSALASAVESNGGKVGRRYDIVGAISAKMPAGKIAEFSKTPEVEKIFYDEIVTLPPQPSSGNIIIATTGTDTIGANYAWDSGYTGAGIKIAIIDTGINYNHADLGGGFGAGKKVAGGYDFVNNDADPMDDQGHGTHVAGTAAANGSIKGVAPNATLYAVKVLNSAGSGTTSNVIAGIDWSIARSANIISMSLGGSSQPTDEFTDLLNIVSDAAVDKGVVVVVAAGNDGPGTGTISTPGSSKKVITVGASDDKSTAVVSDDTIASFSNRGPSAFGRLDPDVVAPGVSIYSTYASSYTTLSGTSMATPHVSGAAALLLQKNPALSPAQVRAILMHTSSNLTSSNIHVFEKGAGIINITKAITYNITANMNGDDRWEESVIPGFSTIGKLVLNNTNTYAVNFTFSIETMTDLEGDNSIPVTSFSVPVYETISAGSSKTVDITFTPPQDTKPGIYGTTLVVSNSTAETLRIPVVITIPLVGSGSITGTVNDASSSSGDWIYYKLRSSNSTALSVYLNWTDSNDDLDLYLYAPNGIRVDVSDAGPGTVSENTALANTVYDEYWAAVHAYSLSGTGSYFLNVSYPAGTKGSLEVSPASWQGVISSNEIKNITFSITNDASAKSGLNLAAKKLTGGRSNYSSGSIGGTGSSYLPVWTAGSNGSDLNNTRYMNATLQWVNSSNDLDLMFEYYDGTQWATTRFESAHNNPQLGQAWERLENVDIQYYLKNYPTFGIAIKNKGGSESYNLTINFTDTSSWSGASVNESSMSLGSLQTRQVNVTINGSLIDRNITDLVFSVWDSTEEFASVPIRIILDVTSPTATANPTGYPSGYTAVKNGTTITLNASVSDNYGVRNASVDASQINSSLGNVALSYSNGFWVNTGVIVAASDGTYLLNITAYDEAGNMNNTAQVTVVVDNTPPLVSINPVTYTRGSAAKNNSNISFNISASDPEAGGISSGLKNASLNASIINNSGIVTFTNQSNFWNSSAAFDKFIPDGNYSLNVTFSDFAGNMNSSQQVNISIDNTPPSVTGVFVSSSVLNMTGSTNITANISSPDIKQDEVFVEVEYPNGSFINYNMSTGGSGLFYYNFTDTAQYGRFRATVSANDTAGNNNKTEKTQFITGFVTINTSVVTYSSSETLILAPVSNSTLRLSTNNTSTGSINITRSNVNVTSNSLSISNPGIYVLVNASPLIENNLSYVIISVNYTDAEISSYVESSLRLYRWNTTSLGWDKLSGAGSFSYVNDAGVDTVNNFVWANLTRLSEFAVSGDLYVPPAQQQASSGGGGGGGGGGGASAENFSNIEVKEKYDMHIFKDKTTSYAFKNQSNPIIFVNITGNISAGEVNTAVEVLRNNSTLVKIPAPGTVYKNINIWVGTSGFAVPRNIREAIITFRVGNEWLSGRFAPGNVALYQYYDSRWNRLETWQAGKNNNYTFFEARTTRFSPFAITAGGGSGKAGMQVEETRYPAGTPGSTMTAVPAAPATSTRAPGFGLLQAVVIIAALYFVVRKRG